MAIIEEVYSLVFIGNMGNPARMGGPFKECKNLSKAGKSEPAQELARDFAMAIYKYLDKVRPQGADKGKTTKTPAQQRNSRPA